MRVAHTRLRFNDRHDFLIYGAVLLFGYISLTPFFSYFSFVPAYFSTLILYVHVLAILLVVLYLLNVSIKITVKSFSITCFFILIVYMLFQGFSRSINIPVYLKVELSVYLRFFLFMLIGYNLRAFDSVKRAMMVILAAGIVVNILSLFTVGTFVRSLYEEVPLTYRLQYMLIPSFFYLFLSAKLTRNERIIVYLAFGLFFIEQVLFQKRLPLGRILVVLLFYVFATSSIHGRSFLLKRSFILLTFVAIGIMFIGFFGFNFNEYFNLLIERFYMDGSVSETIKNDARWEIGKIFIEDLNKTGDIISGRGFGGVVYNETFFSIQGIKNNVRSAAEMGVPTMLLKGGVLLVAFISFLFLLVLIRFKFARKYQLSYAAWVTAFVWFVFIYPEGFIGSLASVNDVLVAYSIGFLLADRRKVIQLEYYFSCVGFKLVRHRWENHF